MKITCRSCGKEYDVPAAGEYCCTCGSSINASEPSHGPERKEKECPACGEMILESAKKCKHCGEWVDGSHREQKIVFVHPPRERKSRLIYITLAVLLGNWGAGEFYIGNYGFGIFLFILNGFGIYGMFSGSIGAAYGLCFMALAAAIVALLININDSCFKDQDESYTGESRSRSKT